MNRFKIKNVFLLLLIGPTYVFGQQICNDDMHATTPDSRFTDNGDGTVEDLRTDLVWQRCPVGYSLDDSGTVEIDDDACTLQTTVTFNWQSALQSAEDLNNAGGMAGITDWRLPNIKELASIVEFQCGFPAINENLFPDTPADQPFWSSTAYNNITTAASLSFESGQNQSTLKDSPTFQNYVRLVSVPEEL